MPWAYLPFGERAGGLRSAACVKTEPASCRAAFVDEGWLRTLPARLAREGDDFSFLAMMMVLNVRDELGLDFR